MPQSWGPTRCRPCPLCPRALRLGILPGKRAVCGSGAGPREPRGGGYRDNLGWACGKQPLGCRLFAFVNPVPKARPFPPRCRFFPATRLRAAGGRVCRLRPEEAGAVRWDASGPRPGRLPRLAGMPRQAGRPLQSGWNRVCDL